MAQAAFSRPVWGLLIAYIFTCLSRIKFCYALALVSRGIDLPLQDPCGVLNLLHNLQVSGRLQDHCRMQLHRGADMLPSENDLPLFMQTGQESINWATVYRQACMQQPVCAIILVPVIEGRPGSCAGAMKL